MVTMRIVELIKTFALVFMILAILAPSLVCTEGLVTQSAGVTDGRAEYFTLGRQEPKVAPVRLRNPVHTMLLGSRIRVVQADVSDGEKTAMSGANMVKPASKRRHQHLRRMLARRLQDVSDGNCNAVAVAARFRSAQRRRKMGPTDGNSTGGRWAQRSIIPRTSRPVKALLILCAARKKSLGDSTAPTRAAPTDQHIYVDHPSLGINSTPGRRSLMQLLPDPLNYIPVPPLPFTRPPLAPRFRFPPLPFTPAFKPQSRAPPPPTPTSILPPFPFIDIPPIPCMPSSKSAKSLPPP